MNEEDDFSLADLMDLDVSDIAEIRFESLPAGLYGFKVIDFVLDEGTNKDDEKRFMGILKVEVLEVRAVVAKGVDKESLIGKQHTEKYYIVPEKAPEGIGRIRAVLTDMGLESRGQLGPLLAAAADHTFYSKIVSQADKNDKSRIYARLQFDPKKKPTA